ncbi:AAA family ATPase [Vibrio parahaemolyticus]|uniref:AAA family ATPase n=1 Tax=Vibrio parahaemolyticus TaxID=670 RepID=UPI0019366310|nr:AAA family ATPase [Vibrio parahaemolyticus]EHK4783241.1 AAA family ATPase [Vibrio parahaemolyticus]EIJ0973760.1 AAA family ATPase [Vibrio parahaemolyticus]EJO4005660.1 AAA family ATPase [Vibrio parahaemolyticus]MBM4987796.1 AAA family ATPase [Vibrio parahaemolyticus]MBM4992224.1 AAA family ATPase [Vibrio parahaemolyticus]
MTTHLSIRLTWHDSGWNGRVCEKPACNASCVQQEHIRSSRKIDFENNHANELLSELEQLPPCSRDVGAYGKHGYTISHHDPLEHRRLPSGTEDLPGFTSCPSPYRWMREENLRDIVESEHFTLRPNDDGRDAGWVYEADRQRELLSHFWGKLEPRHSLVFYYLNQANPLSEEHSRILVGIGRIANIGQQLYFGKTDKYPDDYPIWSRSVTQDYPAQGARLPYQEYIRQEFDIGSILCAVPNSAIKDFSYVGEHVSDDVALSIVERFIQSVQQVKEEQLVLGEWERQLSWLDGVLTELWTSRGAFPGIGSVLQYLGCNQGSAYQRFILSPMMKQGINIWQHVQYILDGIKEPEHGPYEKGLRAASSRWQKLTSRKALLETLARFELSPQQVERIANPELRLKGRITNTVQELVDNPYLICEHDIGSSDSDPVSLETIDHGMRPEGYAALFSVDDEILQDDSRRVRAIAVDILKQAALNGDTILSLNELITSIYTRFPERRRCQPDREIMESDQEFYDEILATCFDKNSEWVALKNLRENEQYIATLVKRRVKRVNSVEWNENYWTDLLHKSPKIGIPKTEREEQAISEKLTSLNKLLVQRVSVLTGGAGTGKTTVLKVFLDGLEAIEGKQPLLLMAPTGKARVRLSTATGRKTETIHQFLLKQGWYDPELFVLNSQSDKASYIAKTVVIDESSMIPTDLFATLLKALDRNEITRLILVGDPNQLPPIGPGRPFADIIHWLNEEAPQCVSSLNTCMRTIDGDTHKISTGLELANSYRASNENPADDELLSILAQSKDVGDVRIRFWKDENDLLENIKRCFSEDLGVSEKDYKSFSKSLGFDEERWEYSENWQILAPTRRDSLGTDELNRLIQAQFKGGLLSNSRNPWKKSASKPFGDSEIIWSDKVIQVQNEKRNGWPRDNSLNYIANGEIGLVDRTTKDYLQVRFSTQTSTSYRYYRGQINGLLELAYALTVHKSQGSDFETVYLIVPNNANTLTRELIYTGLTRFRKNLVLLVQNDIQPLLKLRKAGHSDLEQRNTFIFALLIRQDQKQALFAENLIHRARNGEAMRSKSEVIVANILLDLGLTPRYEEALYAKNSDTDFRLPDFTVSFEGDTYYWEHLGMLSLPSYRSAWERKKQWYKDNGYWDQVITSEDKPDGGIDAALITLTAKQKILLEDD